MNREELNNSRQIELIFHLQSEWEFHQSVVTIKLVNFPDKSENSKKNLKINRKNSEKNQKNSEKKVRQLSHKNNEFY